MPTAAPHRRPGPLPSAPVGGMKLWVQHGTHWSLGTNWSVSRINSRSFYIASDGRTERKLLPQWHAWLVARLREGQVWLDGALLDNPYHPPDGEPATAPPTEVDRDARDRRMLRAARHVLKSYSLERAPIDPDAPGLARVAVVMQRRSYNVVLHTDWSAPPTCTCPDASHGATATGGFCKHSIAACLRWDDLRCQLLDLLI